MGITGRFILDDRDALEPVLDRIPVENLESVLDIENLFDPSSLQTSNLGKVDMDTDFLLDREGTINTSESLDRVPESSREIRLGTTTLLDDLMEVERRGRTPALF